MPPIKFCRVCKSKKLKGVVSLGNQFYTGIFPNKINLAIPKGVLSLVICSKCKLVQLDRNFISKKMYGLEYGYRTSLNKSMYDHILKKRKYLEKFVTLAKNDCIIDIGSNDGSFLNQFESKKYNLIGIDPTIAKFKKYYNKGICKIIDFFPTDKIKKNNAKIITSFAMFYDLKKPVDFSKGILNQLADDGVWHFEQSYLFEMLNKKSYDTICHEHLEYYSLTSIYYIMEKAGFKIIGIDQNDINGGSIAITAAKKKSKHKECKDKIIGYLKKEKNIKLNTAGNLKKFESSIKKHKFKLMKLLVSLNKKGKKIIGYGASTKGNVILQYCKISPKLLDKIYDINPDKNKKFTPGTNIQILSKAEIKKIKFDYFLVFPWHFKDFILKKEKKDLFKNKKFIFPLPKIEIIDL